MLADPKAGATIASFHRQWLTLPEYELDRVDKSPERYPEFDAELRSSMAMEIELRSDYVLRHGGGSLDALLRDPVTFVDDRLAAPLRRRSGRGCGGRPRGRGTACGLGSPSSCRWGSGRGMLTHAGVLTALGTPDNSNIPLRGMFMAEHILCLATDVPNEIPIDLPEPDPDATRPGEARASEPLRPRARAATPSSNPLGFVLDGFGGIGEWREVDAFDNPIDTSANVTAGDVIGDFLGAARLLPKRSPRATSSGAASPSTGFNTPSAERSKGEADLCTYDAAFERFAEADYDISRALDRAVVESESFDHIRVE